MCTDDYFAIILLAPLLKVSIELEGHKQLVKWLLETFEILGGTLIIREMVGLKIILISVSKIYTVRTNKN